MRYKQVTISILLSALGILAARGAISGSSYPRISGQVQGQTTANTLSECHARGEAPDTRCTPGAIDPKVSQQNIQKTICVSGYTAAVRPPVSFTEPLKQKIMARYGYTDSAKNYELDHLISLELGGDPESEQNLWPEPYTIVLGARQKDEVENYLHRQVCLGVMTLEEAQKEISTDWVSVYRKIPKSN